MQSSYHNIFENKNIMISPAQYTVVYLFILYHLYAAFLLAKGPKVGHIIKTITKNAISNRLKSYSIIITKNH